MEKWDFFLQDLFAKKIQDTIEQFIKITSSSESSLFQKQLNIKNNGVEMYLKSLDEMKKFEEILSKLKEEFKKISKIN